MSVYANQCSTEGCCCVSLPSSSWLWGFGCIAFWLRGLGGWSGWAWWPCTDSAFISFCDVPGSQKGDTNLLSDTQQDTLRSFHNIFFAASGSLKGISSFVQKCMQSISPSYTCIHLFLSLDNVAPNWMDSKV